MVHMILFYTNCLLTWGCRTNRITHSPSNCLGRWHDNNGWLIILIVVQLNPLLTKEVSPGLDCYILYIMFRNIHCRAFLLQIYVRNWLTSCFYLHLENILYMTPFYELLTYSIIEEESHLCLVSLQCNPSLWYKCVFSHSSSLSIECWVYNQKYNQDNKLVK